MYCGPAIWFFIAHIRTRPLLLSLLLLSCAAWMMTTSCVVLLVTRAVQFNSETAFFTAVLMCAVFHEFASAALFDCVRRTFSTGSHGRLHEQRNTETSGGEYMALKLALGFGQGAARCLLIPNTIASPHAGPSSYYADLCQNIPFYPTTALITIILALLQTAHAHLFPCAIKSLPTSLRLLAFSLSTLLNLLTIGPCAFARRGHHP